MGLYGLQQMKNLRVTARHVMWVVDGLKIGWALGVHVGSRCLDCQAIHVM